MRSADVHPRLAAALEEQLGRRRAVLAQGADHIGWKIGGSIPEVDGVTGGRPAVGYLTSSSLLPAGGAYLSQEDPALHADTEVVVELASDVEPACDVTEAAAAIGGLGVGLELVDLSRPPSDLEGIAAANVFHRAVAFGPVASIARPLDAEARSVVNGHVRAAGRARGDHGETVQTVARLLGALGERLRRGDRILTGSVTQVPVGPGDEVLAEIEGLGSVVVTIA